MISTNRGIPCCLDKIIDLIRLIAQFAWKVNVFFFFFFYYKKEHKKQIRKHLSQGTTSNCVFFRLQDLKNNLAIDGDAMRILTIRTDYNMPLVTSPCITVVRGVSCTKKEKKNCVCLFSVHQTDPNRARARADHIII